MSNFFSMAIGWYWMQPAKKQKLKRISVLSTQVVAWNCQPEEGGKRQLKPIHFLWWTFVFFFVFFFVFVFVKKPIHFLWWNNLWESRWTMSTKLDLHLFQIYSFIKSQPRQILFVYFQYGMAWRVENAGKYITWWGHCCHYCQILNPEWHPALYFLKPDWMIKSNFWAFV